MQGVYLIFKRKYTKGSSALCGVRLFCSFVPKQKNQKFSTQKGRRRVAADNTSFWRHTEDRQNDKFAVGQSRPVGGLSLLFCLYNITSSFSWAFAEFKLSAQLMKFLNPKRYQTTMDKIREQENLDKYQFYNPRYELNNDAKAINKNE